MSTSIHDILAELRAAAWDERDKGDRFERLIASFLRTDPLYAAKYSDVWRWADWPDKPPTADTGIDLVAREAETGSLCAIQCKFYAENHRIEKADLDKFLSASGKVGFSSRIVISTTDHWGANAEDAIRDQQIPVARIGISDLADSALDWSQFSLKTPEVMARRGPRSLFRHQQVALDAVARGLQDADRGKLIMACGTGKTFTSLRIAEAMVPAGGSVLFLAPSIALVGQTIREWGNEASAPLRAFAVCSDARAGKRTKSEDITPNDLAFPASTSVAKLVQQTGAVHDGPAITVIYSTYQSLEVIHKAQAAGLAPFDLVICDEAHRTTGVTLAGEDESAFVKVHDPEYIVAAKRLYMTATPRIYTEVSKSAAQEGNAVLASMDDPALFGEDLHRLGFGEAVEKGLLTDYKVLVLAVDEAHVSRVIQSSLRGKDAEIPIDDAAKIIGCWNGLAKRGNEPEMFASDPQPMQRAVAFARSIKESELFRDRFERIVNAYVAGSVADASLPCQVQHVDGHHNALIRAERIEWLKASDRKAAVNSCRILTNAKCLSEGVDVPALDAVLFLNPRDSQVDVVQSVGRVMRRAPGKQYGYIILPIAVPADVSPEVALQDNKRYKVVWDVLRALRAHDDRFNALVNKIELNRVKPSQLNVIGVSGWRSRNDGDGAAPDKAEQVTLAFPNIVEWRDAIYARAVKKVGDRRYWEQWAQDIARIAAQHITRIRTLLEEPGTPIRKTFDRFVAGLRKTLNPSITDDDAINMLSQHLITKPVFDALFGDFEFARSNPVSVAMQKMVEALERKHVDAETETLDAFYESVRKRAEGIDNAAGRQTIIAELYEKFFRAAFPAVAQSLGVVYTPVELVDFIIRSVQAVLQSEFGASIADEGVHVLDPFTGTGTFMVRLLQSGLIPPERLAAKYERELHANEIQLLAYYIAAINIEAAYHDQVKAGYVPFPGIVLTDTFQMYEAGDTLDDVLFPQNNERARKQRHTDIRVILGNPPYSVGQGSENDANKNLKYPVLDEAIRRTYAARSAAGYKKVYDSYIRAFRFASDRIKDRGIVCFVSNGAYIDAGSADGFRKALADEFSAIYCLNLRGNQRTAGETSRREGGKIFGQGSRTPIAVTMLVKNPDATGSCRLYYHDIGDYLSREQKLAMVHGFKNVDGVPWEPLAPNAAGDWINVRNEEFESFTPLGDKHAPSEAIFATYSVGLLTARDSWAHNFSRSALLTNMEEMIAVFNEQVAGLGPWLVANGRQLSQDAVEGFIDRDARKISWSRALIADVRKQKRADFEPARAVVSMYRPFCKQWLYFDRQLNEMVYQIPRLFPTPSHENTVICTSGKGAGVGYSVFIADAIPDNTLPGAGNLTQCFPLYHYEAGSGGLFDNGHEGYIRHSALSETTLARYRERFGSAVTDADVFYHVYGVLHSPEYAARFAADLGKMLPRIPMVEDLFAFVAAGRQLADWHLNYETIDPWPLDGLPSGNISAAEGRVTKMRFAKAGGKDDRSAIVVNPHITLSGIPNEAYRYVINGRSAIEWIMERYAITTDKASGIVNDPNEWSDDPRYIVDLVARIVRVSMETVRIIDALPPLGIVPHGGGIVPWPLESAAAAPAELLVADAAPEPE